MRWQHVWQKREYATFSVHLSGRIVLGGKRRHSLKIEFCHKMSECQRGHNSKMYRLPNEKTATPFFPEKTSPKRMAAAGEGEEEEEEEA